MLRFKRTGEAFHGVLGHLKMFEGISEDFKGIPGDFIDYEVRFSGYFMGRYRLSSNLEKSFRGFQ